MRRVNRSVCAVLLAAGCAGSAFAQQDITWSNPTGGAWGNANNWSPAIVPNNLNGNTYNAILSSVGGAYLVTMGTNNTVENFTMDEALATLNLTTRTLTVNQGFTADVGTITSSGTGVITVAGETVFGDVALMGAGTLQANGSLKVNSNLMLDICDTDVDYGGTGGQAAQWQGNNEIQLNMGGTFTNSDDSLLQISPDGDKILGGDGTGSLINDGEMIMLDAPLPIVAPSPKVVLPEGVSPRGGARLVNDLVRVDGAGFVNNGGFTMLRGGFDLSEVVNNQTDDGELNRGNWTVRSIPGGPASRLVFPTRDAVFNINTRVSLLGEGASFAAIDGVSIIGPNGRFEIGDSRNFQTQESLVVIGELVVGQGSFFDAQSGLDNIINGVLSNGSYTVGGTLLGPSFAGIFALSESTVRLIGPNAAFPNIDPLQVIGGGATFSVEAGRFFETAGSFQVAPGGLLRVGGGSAVAISQTLLNASNGVLSNGEFEIAGSLLSGLDPVIALQSTRLALSGPNSQVLDFTGGDAIGALEYVDPDSTLEVRGGRVLVTAQPFVVDGTLVVDPTSAVNPVPGGLSAGTAFETFDKLYVKPGSTVRIGVSPSGEAGVVRADSVIFSNGEAGTLEIDFAEGAALALPYTRSVIRSGDLQGTFAKVTSVGLPDHLKLSEQYDPIIGVLIRVESVCRADMNGDGFLDNGDIGAFVEAFLKGSPAADFNGDGFLDNGDIGAFVQMFLGGC